jgi:hypothetical protein
MNLLDKCVATLGELKSSPPTHPKNGERWALLARLLPRMSREAAAIDTITKARDLPALEALLASLTSLAAAPSEPSAAVSQKEMDAALAAFKKRLNLTRLNDESKLGGRQLSGGHTSQIDGILPPSEFPPSVWKALVAAQKLKSYANGFYGLP